MPLARVGAASILSVSFMPRAISIFKILGGETVVDWLACMPQPCKSRRLSPEHVKENMTNGLSHAPSNLQMVVSLFSMLGSSPNCKSGSKTSKKLSSTWGQPDAGITNETSVQGNRATLEREVAFEAPPSHCISRETTFRAHINYYSNLPFAPFPAPFPAPLLHIDYFCPKLSHERISAPRRFQYRLVSRTSHSQKRT